MYVDKEPNVKNITDDNIINITGESGSGKSTYINKYMNNDKYVVIDTDLLFCADLIDNKDYIKLRELFKCQSKDILITDFDNFYLKVLEYYRNIDKAIVIDSAQYRNIEDYSILKGQIIVMRTCIDTCYNRVLSR